MDFMTNIKTNYNSANNSANNSDYYLANKPVLVERNVKYFLGETLKRCHKFKEQHINFFYNIGLAIAFFTIFSIILFFNYKGGKTAKEANIKRQKDKEQIIKQLLRIKQQNIDDRKMQGNLITNLPTFNRM